MKEEHIRELQIDRCPSSDEEIEDVVNKVRETLIVGASKIVIKIPGGSLIDCIDTIRALYTRFIQVSFEVYEDYRRVDNSRPSISM